MHNPVSTYRIQFHKGFTFQHFQAVIPYLQKLGISTLYASPIFEATPGSTHGYDGLNPHRINLEIGTEEDLKAISKSLKEHGISWLQDIVPNHMAFDGRNPWLMDVLEKGRQSKYASFFDIDWNSKVYDGRMMAPFLGSSLEEVINKGELKIEYREDRFVFNYYDSYYPLHPLSYIAFLNKEGDESAAFSEFITEVKDLTELEDPSSVSVQWKDALMKLKELMTEEAHQKWIEGRIEEVNSQKPLIRQMAEQQVYRLCHWQETDGRINYRRFFTVNGLICLNIQDPQVFHFYHQYLFSLLKKGWIDGLRIDHIDGLYDPSYYLEELRKLVGEETYVIVEKILAAEETLPPGWPVQGNTGYDFLSMVNNLFTNKEAEAAFTQFYYTLAEEQKTVSQQIRDKKSHILYHHMGGELENVFLLFMQLIEPPDYAAMRTEDIKTAIGEFLIHCPVYRYYGNLLPFNEKEANHIHAIFNRVRESRADLSPAIQLLENVLLIRPYESSEEYRGQVLHFYKRCMQYSGPLMAKGVEDTLMYTFHRFIGHNEVGDAPDSFGYTTDEFHHKMKERQTNWPLSLNATSTHDTKRGEDVRARLNVLTDLPEEWLMHVKEWQKLNAGLKKGNWPDSNDEYFIYQTLAGSFPFTTEEEGSYNSRLQEYLQKALREAKRHSNWTTPNEKYEAAAKEFAVALLDKKGPFWKSFKPFQDKVSEYGILNSLAQVLLKFTCPGTPDVYQGCEYWDLSLVDPDNRRPVNFNEREAWLQEVISNGEDEKWLNDIWRHSNDGRIKCWLTHHLLLIRKKFPELFEQGKYVPVKVEGVYHKNVLAFARIYRQTYMVIAVPLHLAAMCREQNANPENLDWKDTRLVLTAESAGGWQQLLVKKDALQVKSLPLQQLFTPFPFALLKGEVEDNQRGAGILMHITSLASPFGIGDLGPEAKVFADFLYQSKQKYWQLLPINPTEGGQGHSPYSATSSRAGNILLISPEWLADAGYLNRENLSTYYLPQEGKTNYEEAEKVKKELFELAWQSFLMEKNETLRQEFHRFCTNEKEWLQDFAFYSVLKQLHEGKPWYEWPDEYKLRSEKALKNLEAQHKAGLQKVMWLQFIFTQQWKSLKAYCNSKGIQLIGDLPFYISYDSADVWAHRHLFSLDEKGNRLGIAGVPPDSFSADGQLWGMPVFRWEVLKEENYHWWIERLKKNREQFDLVRLDHFRAFADYWEVPASEQTARNGEWKPGPGSHFFTKVREELGNLPFVAEDLGEINDAVLELRDEFRMPGMKILQFAFGEDFQTSDYIPHNYTQNFIVYTGTHDNNTVRGWYRHDADEQVRNHLEQYTGRILSEDDVPPLLCRMALGSVAKTAILPLQDVLGLDEMARMNTPASGENNWAWRLLPGQLTRDARRQLKAWTRLYNRD